MALELPERKPRIAAVIGSMAAGKDESARYLRQQYGVPAIEVGRFARELAEETKEEQAHLQYDVEAKKLADYESEYIITRLVAEIVEREKGGANVLVITGLRTPGEAAALKDHFGPNLLLAYVRVGDLNTRYSRVKERDFATDPDDFQEFVAQDEALKDDYALAETAALADITIWNDGSRENLHQQIEDLIVPHLFPGADEHTT